MYSSRRLLKSQSFSHNGTDGNEQKEKPRSASFTQSKSVCSEKLLSCCSGKQCCCSGKTPASKVCDKKLL